MFRNSSRYLFKIICCTFTFSIFSLFLFSQTLIYAADVTLAWTGYKNGTSGAPYNGTGVDEGDSPIKIPLGDFVDSANPEFTLHGLSDTETSYLVLTAYDTEDNESGFSNEVSYHPSTAPTLSSLSISGSDFVNENNSTAFVATATFSDDTTQTVTGNATWSENSVYAGINSSGVLIAPAIPSAE
jgi:hypothetical protein